MQHLTSLQKAHSLRVHPLPKPVLDKDAVYCLLYILWVLDESIYPDERQRVQASAAMLMSTFFGCRLASIFDTRVKLDPLDPNNDDDTQGSYLAIPAKATTASSSGASPSSDEDDDDIDDIDSEGSVTDDDCLAGEDQTRTFLYRHITIFIANDVVGGPNTVFMKITQPNTRGQDNNPRV